MIHFHSDQVDMPTLPFITVKGWMQRVIASHGKREGMIHVIFCSDERILAINVSFLQHDYYTDIITFDTGAGETISGDVYISLDTVASNAHLLSIPTEKKNCFGSLFMAFCTCVVTRTSNLMKPLPCVYMKTTH